MVDQPIEPKPYLRSNARSNLFIPMETKRTLSGKAPAVSPIEEAFTFTRLLQTCYAIYVELSKLPIFYNINTFLFNRDDILLDYLVAITPERRNQIWNLVLIGNPSGLHYVPYTENQHLFTMLTQCAGLKCFSFLYSASVVYSPSLSREQVGEILEYYYNRAYLPDDCWSVWSLPSFRPLVHVEGRLVFDFVDGQLSRFFSSPSVPTGRVISYSDFAEDMKRVSHAVCMRRERLTTKYGTNWALRERTTPRLLEDALRASYLGEVFVDKRLAEYP